MIPNVGFLYLKEEANSLHFSGEWSSAGIGLRGFSLSGYQFCGIETVMLLF